LNPSFSILQVAKQNMIDQSQALVAMSDRLSDEVEQAVQIIYKAKGRLIVSGIGKSAIIGQKIVATLNSTGTPSIFLHAAEAIHGDLGMVQADDVVLCISNSGSSPEIKILLPILQKFGNQIIAMTGNTNSFLAKSANVVLNTYVEKETCPNNLAPTSSTTAQLVMGDSLAVCLMQMRNFQPQDFAKYHPGGALGKKLSFLVEDLLHDNNKPQVSIDDSMHQVIVEISEKRLGVTAVLDQTQVVGIITDGDIRRMLQKYDEIKNLKAQEIMTKNPRFISSNAKAIDALYLMEDYKISQLLVINDGQYMGIIHLHDILKEGIAI
jgi:arabinose-5-phosphate isomerase